MFNVLFILLAITTLDRALVDNVQSSLLSQHFTIKLLLYVHRSLFINYDERKKLSTHMFVRMCVHLVVYVHNSLREHLTSNANNAVIIVKAYISDLLEKPIRQKDTELRDVVNAFTSFQ